MLVHDTDRDNDVEDRTDFNTATTKVLKRNGTEATRYMESSVAHRQPSPRHEHFQDRVDDQFPASDDQDENTVVDYTRGNADPGSSTSVPNIQQNRRYDEEAVLISSDASDQEDNERTIAGGDYPNHDTDDGDTFRDGQVTPKDLSHIPPSPSNNGPSKRSRNQPVRNPDVIACSARRSHRKTAAPHVSPCTRAAQFPTPGNDVPVVLWLNIMLYCGHSQFSVPFRLGCSGTRAVEQVRAQLRQRGVGGDWPELEGLELLDRVCRMRSGRSLWRMVEAKMWAWFGSGNRGIGFIWVRVSG